MAHELGIEDERVVAVVLRAAIARWPLNDPYPVNEDPIHLDRGLDEQRDDAKKRFLTLSRFLLTASVTLSQNDPEAKDVLARINVPGAPKTTSFEAELEAEFAYGVIKQGLIGEVSASDWLSELANNRLRGPMQGNAMQWLSEARGLAGTAFQALSSAVDGRNSGRFKNGQTSDTPPFEFWKRWYLRHIDGSPIPWAVQREVVRISDDVWDAGAEAVAKRIAEIEATFAASNEPDSDAITAERQRSGEALRRHVQHLLEQSVASEMNAVGLAWQIRSEIDTYCNQQGCNETPEELQPFEAIADVLARIGGTLAKAEIDRREIDRHAGELESQIAELQLAIKSLEKKLADAEAKEVKGLIAQGFYRGIGTSLSIACTTTVVGAANYFIAPEYAPEIVRHLGDRFTGLFEKPPQYFPQIGRD